LAPTNKACRNLGKDALTIHKFLGGSMRDTKTLKRQIEGKDYIIVDEISMVKEVFYSLFLSLKKLKPTLKFIIAGDSRQIDPVCDRVRFNYLNSRVLYELCDSNRLLLTKCRRSDKDLFDFSLSLKKENYNNIGKEEHQTSICFTNEKRKERNYYWMKTLAPRSAITVKALNWDPNSQDMKVFKGLPIIARVNNKNYDIFNSEMFTVKEYDGKTKEVHIFDDENEKVIPLDQMTRLFNPAYCVTTCKMQGSTINKPYTIYEWTKMDKKLKYTAVTRSTSLKYLNIV
jgi:ATP-dependent exoDNAse (exonuclease V) alpha subunit